MKSKYSTIFFKKKPWRQCEKGERCEEKTSRLRGRSKEIKRRREKRRERE